MKNEEQVFRFLGYVEAGAVDEIRNMIANGFSPNDTELIGGNSALILAADAGNEQMVRVLVESGLDVNYASDTGETPLAAACFNGNIEIVQYLLESGANITNVDYFGATIFDNARDHPELIDFLNEYVRINRVRGIPKPFVTYFGIDTRVEPGDMIRLSRWFRAVQGVVVYVPRISPVNHFFGLRCVGIQANDLVYSIKVLETQEMPRLISFLARGKGSPPALPSAFDNPLGHPPLRYL